MQVIRPSLALQSGLLLAAIGGSPSPQAQESDIPIVLHVDLKPLSTLVNQRVPSRVYGEGAWGNIGGGWFVKISWERDPIVIKVSGQTLIATTTVRYHGRLAHSVGNAHVQVAQCGWGEPAPTLTVRLLSTFSPQPAWTINPTITVPEPQIGVHCKLGRIDFDVSSRVAGAVRDRVSAIVKEYQQALAGQLAFRRQAQQALSSLGPDAVNVKLGPMIADPDGNGMKVTVLLPAR